MRENLPRDTLVWLDSAGHTQPLRVAPGACGIFIFRRTANAWQCRLARPWERDALARLTSTPGFDHRSVWTPDGKHIVFTSVRHGGVANLYWMRADGAGEAVRLTESKYVQFPYSFSPDGKRLAFDELIPKPIGTSGRSLWKTWRATIRSRASPSLSFRRQVCRGSQ